MEVADELAIRNLIARVARVTDQWETLEQLAAEYVEDGVWHLEGLEPYVGRQGIMRRAREMQEAGICGPGTPMRHIVSTPEVIPDPARPDEATVISFVAMGNMKDGKALLEGYGQYTDTVRKVDGRWYLVKRYGNAFW
ncbi:hypothetical protein A0J57_03895 [Sphingobium sp. 22B]|uniref:nuclear transport factor 2 family protein n=1 Tax=unclassified Sphingobium TaxID=2611147 RepID=UPI0007840470|nr:MULTISPECIES: nuclear transport factor 2 family protein [unclassified Sphingobium]KXU33791.1 hypothetical protein AXW74_00445 [Sphingobium sp. AM]KYC33736.1 hypothetical protein A0J57_03895 [Sphingobium sp. 22B]OAP33476.1 hypothetical protein A8O16_03115 [Sphingobium sp. 20006FA]